MGQIALRDYLNLITELVDEGRLDEAIAHCRNILEQFPRHLETYQLLGRALLDLEVYDDAIDAFKRVLSVDPEIAIIQAGIAIAYSEKDDVQKAISHMELAYDIDPSNQAIAAELSGLYLRRDGHAPAQIDMSRAALARLYIRGSLYKQAANEVAALISEQPDRIDLQIMLAETMYRDQKLKEAARLAIKIVDQLPLCLKANAILAGVWTSTGRHDQALPHLMRVRSVMIPQVADLSEDTLVAEILYQIDQKQVPKKVFLEELDYVPVPGAGFGAKQKWDTTPEGNADDSQGMTDWFQEYSQALDDDE